MTNQLIFKSHTLETLTHEGKIWFTAATLAKVLEYSRGDHISRIYTRNADEFTSCMTVVVENSNLTLSVKSNGYGNLKTRTRVFSLRGAHLIAMFASTPVAKAFRKWVLDLIDKEIQQSSTVTAPNRECLPKMVYHTKSKYNPYRAYVWDKDKNIYVGCFPTVEEAVAAQKNYFDNGEVKRINPPRAQEDAYITNLHCLMHNFRRIDEIWRSHLRPALEKLDSKLVSKLYDRFNDSMCVIPALEERFGKFIPPSQRLN